MEDRPLRVPATEKPRFLNRDMSFGFSIGNIASGNRGLFAPLVGLVAGSMIGKEKMQREEREGRLVYPPTYFNKDAVIGFSDGLILGGLLSIFTFSPAPLLLMGVGGAALEGFFGYNRMKDDYDSAKAYVSKYGEFNPHLQAANEPLSTTLSPKEAMLLQQRLAEEGGPRRSHAEQLREQAEQSAEAQR